MAAPAQAFAAPATLADKRASAAQAEADLQRMQSELASGMSSYAKVSGQLAATRSEIAANTVRLRSLEATMKAIESRLGARASYIYRTSDGGPLDVLFGATSFEEFLARFDFLTRVAEQDAGLVGTARRARVEARSVRTRLRQRETQLVALRDQSAKQRDALAASLARQQAYYRSLSADVAAQLKADEQAKRPAPQPSTSSGGGGGGGGGGSSPRIHGGNGLAVATVDGRSGSYYVMSGEPTHYSPSEPSGVTQASVYSVSDNGGTGTSSGRPLDDSELTCASSPGLGLPMGTHVALTHGGHRVIVLVTDRGPFSPPGRDFDLTVRAASLLGIDGVGDVHYEVVD